MQDLKINLIVNPKCELVAVDNTVYHNLRYNNSEYLDDLTNHVSLEFLLDSENEIVQNSIRFEDNLAIRRECLDGNMSVFVLEKDGTFVYYKYLIPKIKHLLTTDDEGNEYYKTRNQLFFIENNLYYSKVDCVSLEEINEKAVRILDLRELWDTQGTQTFSFQKILFSVCKLQKCLVYLQRKMLNHPDECQTKNNSDRYARDFLFAAMYVFDYLKDQGNYEEAQRILDNLIGCSNYLCPEDTDHKSNCNCGKVVY